MAQQTKLGAQHQAAGCQEMRDGHKLRLLWRAAVFGVDPPQMDTTYTSRDCTRVVRYAHRKGARHHE